MSEINQPVFYDPEGRRWRRVRLVRLAVGIVATTLIALFVTSVLVNPLLPQINLRPLASLPHALDTRLATPVPPTTRRGVKLRRAEGELQQALQKTRVVPGRRPAQIKITPVSEPPRAVAPSPSSPTARPLAVGFYVNWDDSSYESLKRNLAQLDWVVPEWLRLQKGNDQLITEIDPRALDLLRRESPTKPIIPMLHNSTNGQWDVAALEQFMATDEARARLVAQLTQFVTENHFSGICLDLEEVPAHLQPRVLKFAQELRETFRPRGLIVTQAVPFDDSDWDYPAYAAVTDYLMLMAYDQHWAESEPGSIAGQSWFERTLAKRLRELDPGKTIVCVGGYGYDWAEGEETTEMTFQEAVLASRDSEAEIRFDPATLNPYFKYTDDDETEHTVWFLDAVTAYNQMRAARRHGPAGFALWRLGSEDPSLWSVFGAALAADGAPEGLRSIKYSYDVDFEGTGEILQVAARPQEGSRSIELDPATGLITAQRYTVVPSSYVIRRAGDRPGVIALTFDDGPDPVWTPRILDVLKRENVPASFFIIGRNGQDHPDLVRRIVAEGHDIGNHTFTHPNLGEIPGRLTDLELNATQRLIESLTGRMTTLFRPPYFGDAEPTTPDEVEPIVRAENLHYLTIGLHIDSEDWREPGTDEIVKKTVAGALNPDPDGRGQVVLLHDSGGDRTQTVEALPRIISELRARGFRFVTVSELAGLTRDQAMPPVPSGQGLYARTDAVTFYLLSLTGWGLHWLFIIGIILGVTRVLVVGALAFAQWARARRREETQFGEGYEALVSVIVPAYREERVIARTVESLLNSTYRNLEVIVVDDGSPDRTSEVVRERFAGDERVVLFTKENGGKSAALNYGLRHARGEIIVALDADTLFDPETIGALVRRFADPQVGAVAGNAKVGNRLNLVTRWQALEYITAQNLDRRAFASLNCITVVPGAVGAWRRELLKETGGFTHDTLAEDQDLTLRVRRLGYKIGYEEAAIAWTEAPDTLGSLAKQRFRWSYGTLQCMWKHRDALLRPRYGTLGFVAMPNVWVFQILFPLISPLMDLMLLWSFVSAFLERLEHPAGSAVTNFNQILFYYALFLAVDWLAAVFAFLMERREQWSLLWWLFLQRFAYRQVMYYVMVKSFLTAVKGAVVGWGKLERKATVASRPG